MKIILISALLALNEPPVNKKVMGSDPLEARSFHVSELLKSDERVIPQIHLRRSTCRKSEQLTSEIDF